MEEKQEKEQLYLFRRVVASFIDGGLVTLFFYIVAHDYVSELFFEVLGDDKRQAAFLFLLIGFIFIPLLIIVASFLLLPLKIIYKIILNRLFGCTIGKWLCKLSVVTLNNESISLWMSIKREVFHVLAFLIFVLAFISELFFSAIGIIILMYCCDLLYSSTSKSKRMLHDVFSKTKVVRVKK